jgi:uncharacterized protein (UPF0335 family)
MVIVWVIVRVPFSGRRFNKTDSTRTLFACKPPPCAALRFLAKFLRHHAAGNENMNLQVNSRLPGLVSRIERLEEERAALAADIKDVYTEAKSAGYDTKILRKLIAERKLEDDEAREARCLLDLYRRELSGFETTPLGVAIASGVDDAAPE